MKKLIPLLLIIGMVLSSCAMLKPDKEASCTIIIQNETTYGTAYFYNCDTETNMTVAAGGTTTITHDWEYGYDENEWTTTSFLIVNGVGNSSTSTQGFYDERLYDGKTYVLRCYLGDMDWNGDNITYIDLAEKTH